MEVGVKRFFCFLSATFSFGLIMSSVALAQTAAPCPRPAAGAVVRQPPDLYSKNGVLSTEFDYDTTVDSEGRTLFCLTTPSGSEFADAASAARRHARTDGDQ